MGRDGFDSRTRRRRPQSHGDQRVSNSRREGSIPSRPADRGDGSTGEHCSRTAEIGVRFPVAPPGRDRFLGRITSRLEAARAARDRSSTGEQPVCTRSMRVRLSPIPPKTQNEDSPLAPSSREHRPRVGPRSSKPEMRVRFPLFAPSCGWLLPPSRVMSRFSERSVVCKSACEGLIPSRLSFAFVTTASRRVGHPGLSDTELALRSIRR